MRVTNRVAPRGYISVDLPLAKALYCHGISVTLCGNNVNESHVFDNWALGFTLEPFRYQEEQIRVENSEFWRFKTDSEVFDDMHGNFMSYLASELGSYAVFYVDEFDYKCFLVFKEFFNKLVKQNA